MESSQISLTEFGSNIEISALFMLMAEVEMNHIPQLQASDTGSEFYSVHA